MEWFANRIKGVFNIVRLRVWAVAILAVAFILGGQTWLNDAGLTGNSNLLNQPHVMFLVFFAAMFCEYIDSALGMGYGTTLTPLLLLGGFSPLQVVPCVLLSELFTGLSATYMHHRDGNADFLRDPEVRKTAFYLSLFSAVGAASAVMIAIRIPKIWLNSIIAIIVVSVGVLILVTFRCQIPYNRRNILILGLVAAFNKGMSGGGYGPLTTAGQVVSGVRAKSAVAITSLAESFTCLVGISCYWLFGGSLDLALAIPLALGALLSVPLATLTVRNLPEGIMKGAVGIMSCVLGVVMLVKLVG